MPEGMNLNMVQNLNIVSVARISHLGESVSVLSPYSPHCCLTTSIFLTHSHALFSRLHTHETGDKKTHVGSLCSFCGHPSTCTLCHLEDLDGRTDLVPTLVRSIPSLTCDKRCMITLLCSSTDPASPSSSLSSWESKRSATEQAVL